MNSLLKYVPVELQDTKKMVYYLSIGSGLYLTLASILYFRRSSKESKENNMITSFLKTEKAKLGNVDFNLMSIKEKCELCFYYQYMAIKKLYSKDLAEFDLERRTIFEKNTNWKKYIECVDKFQKLIKIKEDMIFNFILKTFNFNGIEIDKVLDDVDKE